MARKAIAVRPQVRREARDPQEHKDHTGVGWLTLGIAIAVVYALFALLGHHPMQGEAHTPLWLGVIVGLVMALFGFIGMSKRRHPGHY
ncbi:hypothetical protein [Arthrobacter sp. JSM 101049]|uniref:hypothetical protein n=1 Tax=Arthrobacter sp. JSM 101049 TaxID=929097 RepID=UPI003566D2A5